MMREPRAQQRRPSLTMSDFEIREFLSKAPVGHIATVRDGQPFLTPTSFWFDSATHSLYLHSAATGRLFSNVLAGTAVCFESSRFGEFLPSNLALEFSVQYESVVIFGAIDVVEDPAAKRRSLYGLIRKYFPQFEAGRDFRPITERELRRTAVYQIVVEEWSGKRNWPDAAERDPNWTPGDRTE